MAAEKICGKYNDIQMNFENWNLEGVLIAFNDLVMKFSRSSKNILSRFGNNYFCFCHTTTTKDNE
jgi:hypothetical protein